MVCVVELLIFGAPYSCGVMLNQVMARTSYVSKQMPQHAHELYGLKFECHWHVERALENDMLNLLLAQLHHVERYQRRIAIAQLLVVRNVFKLPWAMPGRCHDAHHLIGANNG
jgi:hypothetical protein